MARIATGWRGRIIVGLFASNISRIQQVVDIAQATNRKIILNGRSIETSVNIAKELGYINIPNGMEIDVKQIYDFPDDEIVIITTGSQGVPVGDRDYQGSLPTGGHLAVL